MRGSLSLSELPATLFHPPGAEPPRPTPSDVAGGTASPGLLHLLGDSRLQLSGMRGLWLPLPGDLPSRHCKCPLALLVDLLASA